MSENASPDTAEAARFDEAFLTTLQSAIAKAARKGKWGKPSTLLGLLYAISLVQGSGKMPPNLRSVWHVINTVEKRFALCCVIKGIADSQRYPGQKEPWYTERLSEAKEYWDKHNAAK